MFGMNGNGRFDRLHYMYVSCLGVAVVSVAVLYLACNVAYFSVLTQGDIVDSTAVASYSLASIACCLRTGLAFVRSFMLACLEPCAMTLPRWPSTSGLLSEAGRRGACS